MPKGKRVSAATSFKKIYSLKDHIELYGFFADLNGKETMGIHRGLPIWVSWYTLERQPIRKTSDGDNVYETTEEERNAFPQLANVPEVVIRIEDWRHELRSFRTFVVAPEGIPDPDYESFYLEHRAYLQSIENKPEKKRRRKRNLSEQNAIEAAELAEEPIVIDGEKGLGPDESL